MLFHFSPARIISTVILILEAASAATTKSTPKFSSYDAINEIQLIAGYESIDFSIFVNSTEQQVTDYLTGPGMNFIFQKYGTRMMFAAILNKNVAAVDAMLKKQDTPFQPDDEFCMTPLGYLESMSTVHSDEHLIIMKKMKTKRYARNDPQKDCPVAALTNENMIKYLAKMVNWKILTESASQFGIPEFKMNMKFMDGSTLLHQAVLGNNIELVMEITSSPDITSDDVNESWENKKGVQLDISQYTRADPRGWTPFMLAVALNRLELVKKFLAPKVDKLCLGYVCAGSGIDAKLLARYLPPKHRFQMLKVVDRILHTPKQSCGNHIEMADFLNAILNNKGKECYRYHSYLNSPITKKVLFAAIQHMKPKEMNVVIRESEDFFLHARKVVLDARKFWSTKGTTARDNVKFVLPKYDDLKITATSTAETITEDLDIYYVVWEALKRDTTSDVAELMAKLKILHQNGFDLNYLKENVPSFYSETYTVSGKDSMKKNNPKLYAAIVYSGLASQHTESAIYRDPLMQAIYMKDINVIKSISKYYSKYSQNELNIYTEMPYNASNLMVLFNTFNITNNATGKWANEEEKVEAVSAILALEPSLKDLPRNFKSHTFNYSISGTNPACKLEIKREIGWTPLMMAAALREKKVFDFLIKNDADYFGYKTPLGLTAEDILKRVKEVEGKCTELLVVDPIVPPIPTDC